jgi:hypothetical protein
MRAEAETGITEMDPAETSAQNEATLGPRTANTAWPCLTSLFFWYTTDYFDNSNSSFSHVVVRASSSMLWVE